MKTFKELILEDKKYKKLLIDSYKEFLKDFFKVNIKVNIKILKRTKSDYFGDVDIGMLRSKKYVIKVEDGYNFLHYISHEYTHIAQFLRGDLDIEDGFIIWKGKKFMSTNDYSNINNFDEYKKLPWEKEAYENQEKLPKKFLNSSFCSDLKGKDATLDFGIENNLWF